MKISLVLRDTRKWAFAIHPPPLFRGCNPVAYLCRGLQRVQSAHGHRIISKLGSDCTIPWLGTSCHSGTGRATRAHCRSSCLSKLKWCTAILWTVDGIACAAPELCTWVGVGGLPGFQQGNFSYLSPTIGVPHLFACAHACSFDLRHCLAFHCMLSCSIRCLGSLMSIQAFIVASVRLDWKDLSCGDLTVIMRQGNV